MKRIILIALLAVVVIIQLIPVRRPDVAAHNPADLLISATVPDSVAQLLKISCYDCHSNQTTYPWYAHVAPASWLVARDIRKGREALNLSTWAEADKREQAGMLSDMIDEVSGKEMPMAIYTFMHPNARLSDAERKALVDWANGYGEELFK